MNIVRRTVGRAIFSGSIAAGIERAPTQFETSVIGSEQMDEEPGGVEAPAPPEEVFVPLNRRMRHALDIEKGEYGMFVAKDSVEMSELEERLEEFHTAEQHRSRSTGKSLLKK